MDIGDVADFLLLYAHYAACSLAVRQRCPEIAKYYHFYTESGEVCRLKSETLISQCRPCVAGWWS